MNTSTNLDQVQAPADLSLGFPYTATGYDNGSKSVAKARCGGFSKKCMIIIGATVGIIVVIAAVVTAVTVTQVQEMEAAASKESAEAADIVGGTFKDYWPAMVMILEERDGSYHEGICGATMVTPKHAITAAHCVSNWLKNDHLAKLDGGYIGAYAPWRRDESGTSNLGKGYDILKVKTVTEHPERIVGAAKPNDIAIIEFEDKVDTTKFPDFEPMPLCNFDFRDEDKGLMGTVAGFGRTSFRGSSSQQMLTANVPYVPQSTCERVYQNTAPITEDMLCFGGVKGKDACGGDSGGPLRVNGCLAGVVSWGYECDAALPGDKEDLTSYPGVYASVYMHLNWIKETLDKTLDGEKYTLKNSNVNTDCKNLASYCAYISKQSCGFVFAGGEHKSKTVADVCCKHCSN